MLLCALGCFFSHAHLNIVAVQHPHMGIAATLAGMLCQRPSLCPALRAAMARNQYTQRTWYPLRGCFYLS